MNEFEQNGRDTKLEKNLLDHFWSRQFSDANDTLSFKTSRIYKNDNLRNVLFSSSNTSIFKSKQKFNEQENYDNFLKLNLNKTSSRYTLYRNLISKNSFDFSNAKKLASVSKAQTNITGDILQKRYNVHFAYKFMENLNDSAYVPDPSKNSLTDKLPFHLYLQYAFYVNRALLELKYNINDTAFKDLNSAINTRKTYIIPYFFKGILLLFDSKEKEAIKCFREGLVNGYYHTSLAYLMKDLVNDHNLRLYVSSFSHISAPFISFINQYRVNNYFFNSDLNKVVNNIINKDYDTALGILNSIIKCNQNIFLVKFYKGVILLLKGLYSDSIDIFNMIYPSSTFPERNVLCNFRGYSYAKINKYNNALCDYSMTINDKFYRYSSIIHRAEIHIIKGQYRQALDDFSSLENQLKSNHVKVMMAECFIALGEINKCLEVLNSISPEYNHFKYYFCHFLALKDIGNSKDALSCLKKSIDVNPDCFWLLKIAGDYCYNCAEFNEAIKFYQDCINLIKYNKEKKAKHVHTIKIEKIISDNIFYNNKDSFRNNLVKNFQITKEEITEENYLDYLIYHQFDIFNVKDNQDELNMNDILSIFKNIAYAKFYMGEGKNAAKFLKNSRKEIEYIKKDNIDDCHFKENDLVEIGTWLDDLYSNTIKDNTYDLDYRYIVHIINSIQKPFTFSLRDKIVDIGIIKDFSISLCPEDLNSNEIELIKDAERLGSLCHASTYETVQNLNVIRALGLSVLFLANYIKNQIQNQITSKQLKNFNSLQQMKLENSTSNYKKSVAVEDWTSSFEIIRAILQIADFQKDVEWITENPCKEKINHFHSINPTDLNNSAPHYFIQNQTRFPPRFQHVKNTALNKLLLAAFNMKNKHNFTQKDLDHNINANTIYRIVQNDFSSITQYDSGIVKLQAPPIFLRFMGCSGYEVFVSPPTQLKHRRRYVSFIQTVWSNMIKNQSIDSLSFIMMLLWMYHPFTFYSNEVAHILLHAFFLATMDSELERFDSSADEMFISQMIDPNYSKIKERIDSLVNSKTKSEVKKESLLYWNTPRNLGEVFRLIRSNLQIQQNFE